MAKVDQSAAVPLVDAEARRRLAAALDREPVVSALLFGSQAGGHPGPLSDVDVAVWLDPALGPAQRYDARLALAGEVASALGTGEVDLVILNDAPPLLSARAMRDGIRLLNRRPRDRIRLETEALLTYLDTAPLRAEFAKAQRSRIAKGCFGRR